MDAAVQFYGTREEHGYLSNFAVTPIQLKGKRWQTVEHYFQGQKFAGTEHEEEIRYAKSALLAARMGRSRKRPLRRDWDRARIEVMREAVRAKFAQHGELAEQLLATGDARLIEHTHRDHFWADGGCGAGQNWLGRILMEIREELRA
jgi:N-glycosidase YbiA